jgi:hypothetical protein
MAQIVSTVAGSWFGGWMADRGQWRNAILPDFIISPKK